MLLFRDPKDGGTLKIDVMDNKLHPQPITKKVKDVAKVHTTKLFITSICINYV